MDFLRRQTRRISNNPWKPVLGYLVFGILWIYFSDMILGILVQDQELYEMIQTFKGIFYVLITGGLIYMLIRYDARRIHRQAYYDGLTSIGNRAMFDNDMADCIRKKKPFNVVLIDISDFKHLNELHGHEHGDRFLKYFAAVLGGLDDVTAYRWWGDQFLLLCHGQRDEQQIVELIRSVQKKLHIGWNKEDVTFDVSTYMGAVAFPHDGTDVITLNQNLDIAIYKAKEHGKGSYQLYNESLMDEIRFLTQLESELKRAIDENLLELYCQPIYHLGSKEIKSYEILLRWFHKNSMFQNIGKVIAAAERTQQMDDIDRWVIRTLFGTIKSTPGLEEIHFHVNLSSASFNSDDFYDYLVDSLYAYGIDANQITLEITEHTIVSDFEKTDKTMQRLKKLGFDIALDDFGTMYSSLGYVSKLPLDTLKMDKSYIDNIIKEKTDRAIAELIIGLGDRLELAVVAEGVETEEQNDKLLQMGCQYGQGYYFERPKSIGEIDN